MILKSLFARPEQEFYVSQLIRLAGGSSARIQRELRQFTQEGLLTRTRAGNQVRYRANPEHPLFSDLRSLVLKTAGLVDVLKQALAGLAGVEAAFVCGSLVMGEDRADSDVDIVVIGAVSFADTVDALAAAQETLGREVNPTVLGIQEFQHKLSTGNHFVSQIIKGPKLFVIGEEDDLERMGRST